MLQQSHVWNEDNHAEAREMWREGRSLREIADHFCISRSAVGGYASRNRDEFPPRKKGQPAAPKVRSSGRVHAIWTDARLDVASRLWAEGVRSCEIADRFKVSTKAFLEVTRRFRQRFPKRQNQVSRPKVDIDALFEEIESTSLYDGRKFLITGQEPVSFGSLKIKDCRFPVSSHDEPCGADMACCGARIERGRYCAAHFEITHRRAA